ncbi:potassium channel family protein [Williamsia soli]|uniref:potassium channel family protein n=1 Tax=Williamsia soli TaxID=364929 RepID=UPI001A9CBFB5|nr:potassium channel family protein [Williamsia soli]
MTPSSGTNTKIVWPKRLLVLTSLRSLATVVAYLVAYFALPWKSFDDWAGLAIVVAFLGVALLTAVWQIGQIMRSATPAVKAIEALAIIAPIYLLAFSLGYYMLSVNDPAQFNEPLSRMSSLYFTISVFATVGFGDITASVDVSRAVVTVQMVLNLIVVGVGIKIILAAVKWGRDLKKSQTPPPGE